MNDLLYIVIAYFLGGIPFGLLIGYISGQGDIRKKGSGNTGATNVWRLAGPVPAIFVFVGDIGKGVLAVKLAALFYPSDMGVAVSTFALMGGIAAVLGHTFPPYLRFRGGKGVNTALGVFISLLPLETLCALAVFIIVVAIFRFISLGSILSSLTLAAVLFIERFILKIPVSDLHLAVSLLLAGFILFTHRKNIVRLIAGTENRFTLRKASP